MNTNELEAALRGAGNRAESVIPFHVANRIDETLHRLPDRAMLARGSRRKRLAVAAASLVLLAGIAGAFALSSSSPDAGSGVRNVPSVGAQGPVDAAKPLPEATDQGITLKITKAQYDGYGFVIDFSMDGDLTKVPLKDFESVLTVNGDIVGRTGKLNYPPVQLGVSQDTSSLSKFTIKQSFDGYSPDSLKVKYDVSEIGGIKGNWSVSFVVGKTSPLALVENAEEINNEMVSLRYNKLALSSSGTTVDLTYKAARLDTTFGLELYDDEGRRYGTNILSGGNAVPLKKTDAHLRFETLDRNANSAILKPFYFETIGEPVKTTMTKAPTESDPLFLRKGSKRETKITKIEYAKDKTVVHVVYPPREENQIFGDGFSSIELNGSEVETINGYMDNGEYILELAPVKPGDKLTFVYTLSPEIHYMPDLDYVVDLRR